MGTRLLPDRFTGPAVTGRKGSSGRILIEKEEREVEVGMAFGWRGVPTTGGAAVILSN